jgi:hypothetical protein
MEILPAVFALSAHINSLLVCWGKFKVEIVYFVVAIQFLKVVYKINSLAVLVRALNRLKHAKFPHTFDGQVIRRVRTILVKRR